MAKFYLEPNWLWGVGYNWSCTPLQDFNSCTKNAYPSFYEVSHVQIYLASFLTLCIFNYVVFDSRVCPYECLFWHFHINMLLVRVVNSNQVTSYWDSESQYVLTLNKNKFMHSPLIPQSWSYTTHSFQPWSMLSGLKSSSSNALFLLWLTTELSRSLFSRTGLYMHSSMRDLFLFFLLSSSSMQAISSYSSWLYTNL